MSDTRRATSAEETLFSIQEAKMEDDIFKFLRRKADFLEGFGNALPELQRAWLLNHVVDMRRLLNELEKRGD